MLLLLLLLLLLLVFVIAVAVAVSVAVQDSLGCFLGLREPPNLVNYDTKRLRGGMCMQACVHTFVRFISLYPYVSLSLSLSLYLSIYIYT